MSKMFHFYSPTAPLRATLVADYRRAIDALVERIKSGTKLEILIALRAALVAEAAVLFGSGGAFERAIAESLHLDIAQVERDMAELTDRRPS